MHTSPIAGQLNVSCMSDHHDHHEIYNRGLQFDVSTLLRRRGLLGLFAGVGAATLVGCGTDTPSSTPATSGAATTTAEASASATASTAASTAAVTGNTTEEIPEETAGPYPGDGTNGPNILTQSGIVRSDIRSSMGSASGTAGGVPLTINLTVLDLADASLPLAGGAVYLWHCDREGRYSMYSAGVTNENYLRGVQEIDAAGKVSFTSIFPACYSGRWPHIHFEVYRSLASATNAGNKIATSQVALPKDACDAVYATTGYSASVRNLAQTSLVTDNVFSDSWTNELGTVTGSVTAGMTVQLNVPVR
jgi:protocatechuate 3,4-dioxygenase beta subunit